MFFSYQLTNNKGKIISGKVEADSLKSARNKLMLQEGTLISLEKINKKGKKTGGGKEIAIGRVRLIEKVMLAKHLSVMIKSGMSIDGALEVLIDNASAVLAKQLKKILAEVRKGTSLSEAFKKYGKDFDLMFVNMIAVGERSGSLAKNLELLAVQQKKTYDLKTKIKAAAMYPTVVLLAVVGLAIVMSVFVLPKIVNFFNSLSMELPWTTRAFIGSAQFFIAYWMWVAIGVALVFIIWRVMLKIPVTRLRLHGMALKLVVVGKITKHMNLALFCRTLASLLDSGITIDQSLQIVSQTLTNDVYKKGTLEIYQNILKGSSLADSLEHRKEFPSLVSKMSRVGEESGNLSEVLEYLANFYESEVDNATKNLSTMLEPILLVIIGLAVGFVAMSIINPIYDLTSKVGH